MIYYGAEIGMWGADDPCCRMPMAWDDVDAGMLEHYRTWMNLRRDAVIGPVLRYGGVRHVASGDADVLVFERYLNDVVVRVTANRATATVTHEVVKSKNNRTP
jgi:glycosidase